jgi:inhibitor of KinA
MTITPLGDQAVLAAFGIEADALRFAAAVRAAAPPGVVDVVAAYVTVAIFYDLARTRYARLATDLERLHATASHAPPADAGNSYVIPCCYVHGPDLTRVADHTGLPPAAVIRLHSETEYTVYAIGFCPGFPYLGYLPPPLCGVPRLPSPRVRVEPGSVGLTGRQTGLYPLERPGGWNLIGRTPLTLVDVAAGYFPLRPGDRVRFTPIDEPEFERLKGTRPA